MNYLANSLENVYNVCFLLGNVKSPTSVWKCVIKIIKGGKKDK